MNMVATILFEYRSKTVKRAKDLKQSAEQHRNIYRAMREKNANAARDAMHEHLTKTQAAQRLEVEDNFPDGNGTVARLLVRWLLAAAMPGTTMEDAMTARVDYARLDEPAATSSDLRIE